MGLEEVVKEILTTAENKAKEIRKDAKKQAESIIKNAEMEIEELKKRWEEENRKIEGEIRKKRMASAKLEASKLLMDAKREIIQDVMDSLLKKLISMDRREKEKLIRSLAELAKEEIEVTTVYCNKQEEKIIAKYFKDAKIKHTDCEGGFIAENKDGSISVDMRYKTLIEKVRKDIIKEVGSRLFKDFN